mmetsp:Transcript_22870/g.70023  ORF Transcript_22870/g.70023 Transcript_22870/m.70023 type:complete len:211 (-) Transcript_22870:381-1013(-)
MPRIVGEPAQVPNSRNGIGLHIVRSVCRLADERVVGRASVSGDRDFRLPERPCPRAAPRLISALCQLGLLPRGATVSGHVDTNDAATATTVCKAAYIKRCTGLDNCTCSRFDNEGLYGHLLHSRRGGDVLLSDLGNIRPKNFVSNAPLPHAGGVLSSRLDLGEPLCVANAHVPGDHDAYRGTVVKRDWIAIHLVRKQHIAHLGHSLIDWN